MTLAPLPVCRVGELEAADARPRWLIESLWSAQAVGFVAGQPKLGKTWFALDLALSVATGTPCLDTYAVAEPGEVLVYLAEDPPTMVRQRLSGLCRHRGLELRDVPIHVVTEPCLRLDLPDDRARLDALVGDLKPRLLVLDPLVRLHRRDENHSGDVSELLSYLRALQRAHALAIVVVHHMRKGGARRGGQALRGSSDLHAWTDSALYLQSGPGTTLALTVEHRAAPAPDPLEVRLCVPRGPQGAPHLEVVRRAVGAPASALPSPVVEPLTDRLLATLRAASRPLTRVDLRAQLRVNNQRLGQVLDHLEQSGQLARAARGWQIETNPRLPGETESGSAGAQPDEG